MQEEKTNNTKDFTKLTQKKGISLIVLIVTIIVIIILAVAIVLTVNKNNPIDSANEAVFKENIRGFQNELAMSISNEYVKDKGKRKEKINTYSLSDMQKYIPSFTKEYEGKIVISNDELVYNKENVEEKEEKWLADLGVIEIPLNAVKIAMLSRDYYGQSITNYSANGVNEWKIFYSDKNNIYLISSDYLDVDKLPTTGAGHKPENTNSSYPKAAQFDNIINDYDGSSDITDEKIKALNNDYFNIKKYTSTNSNMKAVAYMLDTEIWSDFAGEKAEYVIGGPTVEMIMASYSQKYASEGIDFRAQASINGSNTGYQISNDGGTNWNTEYLGMLKTSDSLYVLSSSNGATAMWIASTAAHWHPYYLMYVNFTGNVSNNKYSSVGIGFRPLVCLKSNVVLEDDGAGYKIK